jgi:Arc/MetJ-type ribon-helix-helix transcriptional regulator
VYGPVADGFWGTHEAAIGQLARDLKARVGERVRVGVAYGGYTRGWAIADPSPFTPVMARLDRPDLETLDALIAAGSAPNRADAIRWALARVRERPVYAQLVARVREVQALRAELEAGAGPA